MFLQPALFCFKYIFIFVLNVGNLKGRHRHLTMPFACTVGNLTIFFRKVKSQGSLSQLELTHKKIAGNQISEVLEFIVCPKYQSDHASAPS